MSEELLRQASDEDIITWVRAAIEDAREVEDGLGVTVDLTHKNIVNLPREAIEVMKMEIERLAISHNRIMSFPPRLAECHRLRYLNVRFNALKEVPTAILQLESLEILDLSRNRIKILPEEIGNLTSLKVLAITKNKIERLPIRLGELSRLHLLKFDENPLVFPKPEAYALDAETLKTANPNEIEAAITAKVKRVLNKAKNKSTSKDIDSDIDPAKTPRPGPRKGQGRYPVKTSLSRDGLLDQAVTSPPDAPPVPSIPSQHQIRPDFQSRATAPSRPQRGFTASIDAPILWSPNQSQERLAPSDYQSQLTGSTLRSDHRSHAIITPRLPPGSARFELMTSPDGSDGSGTTAILMGQGGNVVTQFQPNISKSIDSPKILSLWSKAVTHGLRALVTYIKVVDYIRNATANIDLSESQLMAINGLFIALIDVQRLLEDRLQLIPLAQTPKQINLVGRAVAHSLINMWNLTASTKPEYEYTVPKVVTEDIMVKLVIALNATGDNTEIVSNLITAQYQTASARTLMSQARALLPAEFFQTADVGGATVASRRPLAPNMQTLNTSVSSLGQPTLNTAISLAVRPVQSATQSPVGMSATSSFADFTSDMRFASSPTASEPPLSMWNSRLHLDPDETRRNEARDAQYTKFLALLGRAIHACLSPESSALKFLSDCMHDKDQTVANDPPPANGPMAQKMWHDTAMALTHCLASTEKVVEYLPVAQTAKEFSETLELQEYIRMMISYWADFCSSIMQIRRAGLYKGMPGMIPKYMQMIHVPLKEFTKFCKASPEWIHLAMDASVLSQGKEGGGIGGTMAGGGGGGAMVAYNGNIGYGSGVGAGVGYAGSSFGGGSGFGAGSSFGEAETPSGENFPQTPLGAALGPAAAAAIPRPNAAFMSRYDQYASATNRRY